MKRKSQISIEAFVSEDEREAVQLAADFLARSLSQAAGVPWTCTCGFSTDVETLRQAGNAAIVVTSFLPELGNVDEPWPQAELRLRTAYAALRTSGIAVFICTILRHVGHGEEPKTVALRVRIRRLNLLAAEISRETGAYVIDVDRVLANIGARHLQTDYRLKGSAATGVTGHLIALALLNNACDSYVSIEIQESAKSILDSSRPAITRSGCGNAELAVERHLPSIGKGRRKQVFSPAIDVDGGNPVRSILRQIAQGAIGPSEAIRKLGFAVRRRGVRQSAVLIATALSKQHIRKK